MTSAEERPAYETWVVDRIEGDIAVLVEEEGEIVVELSAGALGPHAEEGAVLRVPLGSVGEPVWSEAVRDLEAEEEWLRNAEARLERLEGRDPGGDVEL
jgi:hypothetical protein